MVEEGRSEPLKTNDPHIERLVYKRNMWVLSTQGLVTFKESSRRCTNFIIGGNLVGEAAKREEQRPKGQDSVYEISVNLFPTCLPMFDASPKQSPLSKSSPSIISKYQPRAGVHQSSGDHFVREPEKGTVSVPILYPFRD